MNEEEIKKSVREQYGKIARNSGRTEVKVMSCCGQNNNASMLDAPKKINSNDVSFENLKIVSAANNATSCCGPIDSTKVISSSIGYSQEEMESVPQDANLGLGCGNPTAHASIKEGEVVLDLGSGGGFDCFLAAKRVGKTGKVIGVDMTHDMLALARKNAIDGKYDNVEFRLGEIENLPVADNSVDLIISNCVINLSTNKARVYEEAFRVLKPGGRMFISDIVILKELPDNIKNSIEAYTGCVSGAILKDEYIKTINNAGFKEIEIQSEVTFPIDLILNAPGADDIIARNNITEEQINNVENTIASIKVKAIK